MPSPFRTILHAARTIAFCVGVCLSSVTSPAQENPPPVEPSAQEAPKPKKTDSSRLSDEPIPLRVDLIPERPAPPVELGPGFLSQGDVGEGLQLPTGAVWNPQFQVFGTYRTAVQAYHDGRTTFADWANRLDIFANLQLTGTERILLGMRPLDDDANPFSGYVFSPSRLRGFENGFDARIQTLFFEGDLGEIFPKLDSADRTALDFGFAVGRQPLLAQEGLLIDDDIDSVGIIRNTLRPFGASNLRITGLFGWNDVNRGNNVRDGRANLFGIFTEADLDSTTVALDLVYVETSSGRGGDAAHVAASAVQRLGRFNTAFRALASLPLERETPFAGRGLLLFSEVSLTPHGTDDLVYLNAFWALGDYTSAARGPDRGGPLGRVGVLFSAVGLGRYASALLNEAQDVVGAALGWQQIFDGGRRQVILEAGFRLDTDGSDTSALAVGARFQQAFGRRFILRVDTFASLQEDREPGFGGRVEFIVKF